MTDLEILRASLAKAGQSQVLDGWERLDEASKTQLLAQCQELDLETLGSLWETRSQFKTLDGSRAKAIEADRFDPLQLTERDQQHREIGERLIRSGQVGVLIVAGGQGTRLGFDRPKGLYSIGPVSGRNLFEFILDRIDRRALRLRAPSVPVWIMTSDATHVETVEYFDERRGRWPSLELTAFRQGVMPVIDAEHGKVLLTAPGQIAMSPDGHGGMIKALAASGGLERLKSRGVGTLFYCQIDNPLVDALCPEMIGAHAESRSQMTTLVVRKLDPLERVGNLAMFDGRMAILEYSDIDEQQARRTDSSGNPIFWAGNTGIHLFDREFLELSAQQADALPFHWAKKKVAWWSSSTGFVEASEPNAIKFERFIFDLMPRAERTHAIEIKPRDYFAPVKNAPGAAADTPETCQRAILGQADNWLKHASIEYPEGARIEIAPSLALDPFDLFQNRERVRLIESDEAFLA